MPRPGSVTLLAIAVGLLGAYNLLGALNGLRGYTVLSQLPLSLPPAYLIASNGLWAAVFLTLAVGLWRLKEWARRGLLAAAALYVAQGWVERLVFSRSDYARTSLPFYVAVHALGLACVWITLLRRDVRRCFSAR